MQREREQLLAMVALMWPGGMVPMLTGKDFSKAAGWEPAAGKWNGKAFRKHNYHGRMATAYVKHTKNVPMLTPTSPAILLCGMKGEEARNLQSDLADLNYVFDGRFGDETDEHVRDFQAKRALTVDGRVGDDTRKAIAAVRWAFCHGLQRTQWILRDLIGAAIFRVAPQARFPYVSAQSGRSAAW